MQNYDWHTLVQQLSTPIISVACQILVPMAPGSSRMVMIRWKRERWTGNYQQWHPSTLSIPCWHWQRAKAREVKSQIFLMQDGFVGCLLSKLCPVYLEEYLHNSRAHLSASLLQGGCENRLTFKEEFQSLLPRGKSIVMYSAKPQASGPQHPSV